MQTKYKLLLLDADNTLLDFDAAERHALSNTFADCGWEYNEQTYACYHSINDALWKELEKGNVTRSELKLLRFARTADWMRQNGYHVPANTDLEYMCARYILHLGECGKLLDGADALCAALKERYRLSIITNGTASVQYSRMKHAGLEPYFEHLFISEEIGAEKPSPDFFAPVFAAFPGIDRREMLVIGDSISSDMKGAYNAGIDACYLNAGDAPQEPPIRYHAKNFEELMKFLLF